MNVSHCSGSPLDWVHMEYRIAADLLLIIHLLFIIFVVLGGLLLLRSWWWPILHIPAVFWVALLEFNHWICPLTPWENQLRKLAGDSGYQGGFIEHYLLPVIYPEALTPFLQLFLGGAAIVINISIYTLVIRRLRRQQKKPHQ